MGLAKLTRRYGINNMSSVTSTDCTIVADLLLTLHVVVVVVVVVMVAWWWW